MIPPILLPWPDKRLSPNGSHGHWAAVSKAKKAARSLAMAETFNALPYGLRDVRQHYATKSAIPVLIVITPPDNRKRDRDNMQFMCSKSYLDGVADALAVNDNKFRPQYEFRNPMKPGRVEVHLG
jgi:crossover junction endodeoxyribonuclease RusA